MLESLIASGMLVFILCGVFFFNIIIASIAKSRGRSWFGWFIISCVIDPVLAFILVLVLDRKN